MQKSVNDHARPELIASKQSSFLLSIWRRHTIGFVFLAVRDPNTRRWQEESFDVRRGWGDIRNFLASHEPNKFDGYFCPNAFNVRRRISLHALPTPFAWCDIDGADPAVFDPAPSILIETSPGRTQGIWQFTHNLPASKAEAVSRHLAYSYRGDRNGWSVTKFLRLPYSFNHKPQYDRPLVKLIRQSGMILTAWPKLLDNGPVMKTSTESFNPFKYDPRQIADKYRRHIGGDRYRLMTDKIIVSRDRSRCVFMIVASLLDAGANPDEIAAVVWHSPYFISKFGQSRAKLNEELSRTLAKLRGAQ